jgi:hypothetical protein
MSEIYVVVNVENDPIAAFTSLSDAQEIASLLSSKNRSTRAVIRIPFNSLPNLVSTLHVWEYKVYLSTEPLNGNMASRGNWRWEVYADPVEFEAS